MPLDNVIITISGARRVGKTTMLLQLVSLLKREGYSIESVIDDEPFDYEDILLHQCTREETLKESALIHLRTESGVPVVPIVVTKMEMPEPKHKLDAEYTVEQPTKLNNG